MTTRRLIRLAPAAILIASVAACSAVPDVMRGLGGTASAVQLNAPWQARPMLPAAEIVAEADRVCRADIQFQAGLPLLVVDARGAGRLQLYYGDASGSTGECNAIFVARDGTVRPGGSGGSGFGEAWPPIAAEDVVVMSSGGSGGVLGEDERHLAGRVGPAVASVRISVTGLAEPIEATVDNGWWATWWPGGGRCTGIVGVAADGSVVDSLSSC